MSKYRIIKSIAYSEDFPYILQRWVEPELTWERVDMYDKLQQAKAAREMLRRREMAKVARAKVVWEEDDNAGRI